MINYEKMKEYFNIYNSPEGCFLDKFLARMKHCKLSETEAYIMWMSFDTATDHWFDVIKEKHGIILE